MYSYAMYVPTSREALPAIENHLSEFSSCRSTSKGVFILVENALDANAVLRHRKLLDAWSADIDIVHFTETVQWSFVNHLMEGINDQRLERLLTCTDSSYGRNPNLAYLLSVSLGVRYLTRRDSDVYSHPIEGELPLALELNALGLSEPSKDYPLLGSSPQSTPFVIGTGTYGDPTVDRRELFSTGMEAAVAFQALGRPGVSIERVREEALEYLVVEPARRYDSVFYDWRRQHIEMSACGLRDLFWQLPEVPASIIGCDYMNLDLARSVRLPVLYHSAKMLHQHHAGRNLDISQRIKYRIDDLRYMQMGHIWRRHGERVRANPSSFWSNGSLRSADYAQSFRDAAREAVNDLADVRLSAMEVFQSVASRASVDIRSRSFFGLLVEEISRCGAHIDSSVSAAIDDFCYLVEAWPRLVERASLIDSSSALLSDN